MKKRLASVEGKPYFVFHEAFDYFEAAYGLKHAGVFSVLTEVQPGARHVAAMRKTLQEAGPSCVFSEPPLRPRLAETLSAGLPVKLAELDTPADWDSSWTKDAVMVVAVPLDIPKRNLQGFFARLLKDRHGGKRGRKALSDADASNARYPLHRNASIHTLRIQLAVYDAVLAARASDKKITLAQIGERLKLVPKSNKRTEGEVMDAARRRSVLAATVSRHFKDAQRIVANTARGQFPNSD